MFVYGYVSKVRERGKKELKAGRRISPHGEKD
jgi:hypothetical protein